MSIEPKLHQGAAQLREQHLRQVASLNALAARDVKFTMLNVRLYCLQKNRFPDTPKTDQEHRFSVEALGGARDGDPGFFQNWVSPYQRWWPASYARCKGVRPRVHSCWPPLVGHLASLG